MKSNWESAQVAKEEGRLEPVRWDDWYSTDLHDSTGAEEHYPLSADFRYFLSSYDCVDQAVDSYKEVWRKQGSRVSVLIYRSGTIPLHYILLQTLICSSWLLKILRATPLARTHHFDDCCSRRLCYVQKRRYSCHGDYFTRHHSYVIQATTWRSLWIYVWYNLFRAIRVCRRFAKDDNMENVQV